MASIAELPVKTLVQVLKDLSGGEIGFDPYRDERTSKKDKLLSFILKNHSNDAIIKSVQHVLGGAVNALIDRLPKGMEIAERPLAAEIDANRDAWKHANGIIDHPEAHKCPIIVTFTDPNLNSHVVGFDNHTDATLFCSKNPANRATGRYTTAAYQTHLAKLAAVEAKKAEAQKAWQKAEEVHKHKKESPKELLEDAKLKALKALLAPSIDVEQVQAIVDERSSTYIDNILDAVNGRLLAYDAKIEALTQKKPIVEKIIIEMPGREAIEIKEHVNPAFHEIVAIASHYPNIMMVGPAGCGKTHLARQVSLALGKSFSTISGSAGISESHFTGRLLPTGENGRFEYTESPFIAEYKKSDGCFLIDEFDALDPNCIMVCQGATANNGFTIEARKAAGLDPFVARGQGSLLLASANTYGTGADSLYVGRFQQDAAASDRWYFVPVDYDKDLESTLAPEEICDWVWGLREKVQEHRVRRIVSTRMIQKAAAAKLAKRPMKEIRERMLAGWTREERQKCGVCSLP